jgi:hypothetical protein
MTATSLKQLHTSAIMYLAQKNRLEKAVLKQEMYELAPASKINVHDNTMITRRNVETVCSETCKMLFIGSVIILTIPISLVFHCCNTKIFSPLLVILCYHAA